MDLPKIAGTSPIKVAMEEGKKYAWCTCGLSDKQPFCNGAHKGSDYRPNVMACTAAKTVHFCTCKQTKNPNGFCDGAHKAL